MASAMLQPAAGDLLTALDAALDLLEVQVQAGLGAGPGDGDTVVAVQARVQRLTALQARAVAGACAGSDWSAEGFAGPRSWLRARTVEGRSGVGRLLAQARALRAAPLLGAAWLAGDVTWAHVDVFAKALAKFDSVRDGLSAAEGLLTEHARVLEPEQFAAAVLAVVHALDPDAVDEADAQKRRREVGLHVSALLDGFVRVDGLLPPEVGMRLLAALEAARSAPPAVDDASTGVGGANGLIPSVSAEAGDPGGRPNAADSADTGDPVLMTGLARQDLSEANVAALAFVLDAAASVLPAVHGQRPFVSVTVPVEALTGAPGALPGWFTDLAGGGLTPVSGAAARRLACDARVRLLLVDAHGNLEAIGAGKRIVPAGLRTAVLMRDGGRCRFPGCRSRIHEVHHVRFWSDGGPTVLANLAGLCGFHHHLVHEGGWQLTGNANGRLTFRGIDGRTWCSDSVAAHANLKPDRQPVPA